MVCAGANQLAAGFLLQGRSGEGRLRIAPRRFCLDRGNRETGGLDRLLEIFASAPVPHVRSAVGSRLLSARDESRYNCVAARRRQSLTSASRSIRGRSRQGRFNGRGHPAPARGEAEDFKKAIEAASFTVPRSRQNRRGAIRRRPSPLDPAAGSQPQAWFCAGTHHADCPAALRGHRYRGETTGLITYMRTDGVQIDNSAIVQARKVIGEDYGNAYVPDRRANTRPRPRTRRKRTKHPSNRSVAPAGRDAPSPRYRSGPAL